MTETHMCPDHHADQEHHILIDQDRIQGQKYPVQGPGLIQDQGLDPHLQIKILPIDLDIHQNQVLDRKDLDLDLHLCQGTVLDHHPLQMVLN